MLRSFSRPVAALALVVGAVLATGSLPASAAPTSTSDPVRAGGGYVARQLAAAPNGLLTSGGYPQVGETIDAELALASAKVARHQQAVTLRVLRGQASSYIQAQDGSATVYYPGSLAKMAILAQAEGADPDSFGGVALLATLRGLLCTGKDSPAGCTYRDIGLYKSVDSAAGDPSSSFAYDSPVTQALALIALSRSGSAAPPFAAAWLVGQQCPDGGFSDVEHGANRPCADGSESVDNTAYAVQALVAMGRNGAAKRGTAYLLDKQAADGSLPGAAGASANSTALAAQAFTSFGRDDAAAAARSFLVSVQAGCSAPADQRGAIAAPADGDPTFASVQAVQGLSAYTLTSVSAAGSTPAVPTLACPEQS